MCTSLDNAHLPVRVQWHPDPQPSVLADNLMHVGFLLYMLIVLPINTAFGVDPSPGSVMFAVDVVIDSFIVLDILLNFRCVHPEQCSTCFR